MTENWPVDYHFQPTQLFILGCLFVCCYSCLCGLFLPSSLDLLIPSLLFGHEKHTKNGRRKDYNYSLNACYTCYVILLYKVHLHRI